MPATLLVHVTMQFKKAGSISIPSPGDINAHSNSSGSCKTTS
ncbi:MAG: hypothetical protein ABI358_08700 [Ginsengibacter sp.]